MAEPRYQVFVSSTYTDLKDERQAVMSALLQLGAMPAGMELFPAADDEAWILVQRVIDESDYYLLVIGGRYGSVTDEGLSFTEKEYDYATKQGKPVMAFVHGRPEAISMGKSEPSEAARERLGSFVGKVKKAKHVKTWTSGEDLAGKIALSFTSFVRSYPAAGWVRGDQGDSPETLKALAEAQRRIAELEASVTASALTPPPGTEGLATETDEQTFYCSVQFSYTTTRGYSERKIIGAAAALSWNELLNELGPMMLNESREDALLERLGDALYRLRSDSINYEIRDWIVGNPSLVSGAAKNYSIKSIEAEQTDLETVLVQFQALGLITQSTRARSVKDTGTYWSLTPWGRHRLTQLRAIRKEAGDTAQASNATENTRE